MAAITVVMSTWSHRKDQVEQLRHKFSQIEFVVPSNDAEYAAVMPRTHVVVGRLPQDLLPKARNLRWVQNQGAGVDRLLTPEIIASDVIVTNAQSLHATQISEHVLTMMLAFARGFLKILQAQRDHVWRPPDFHPFCLEGQTLGVIGAGGIGGALAEKAHHLGMHVIGLRRHPKERPAYLAELVGPEGLHDLLRRSDHVAVCCPLTEETKGLVGETELRLMKQTAYIYNIGRGKIIQAEPLLQALKVGWIAGAGLDVTDPEPLPPDSELWDMPNVIVTQHTSGTAPHNDDRFYELLEQNFQRFLDGEQLLHVVDKEAGY
ncbi:MAG: D-2-hydroxyacid dehydrogenase [Chloroflexi bacterium]|nr:D-2-hydroxyacid dehydrogenase [Chloroflexota bacterium]